MCSCGNGCGPIQTCGGHCTQSSCNGECNIECWNYCLHSNCGFSCGGDETIERYLNCNGFCTSSSCSATRFRIKMLYKARFLYKLRIYIIYMIQRTNVYLKSFERIYVTFNK